MSGFEKVIYIQGLGNKPEVQRDLPELWLPHGLSVERQSIDWTAENYDERLAQIGGRIIELSKSGNVSIVAASGGVKTMMSLFARHLEHLHRGLAINGKFEPFDLEEDAEFWAQYPNIAKSSETMQQDYAVIDPDRRKKIFQQILWLYSHGDKMIPKDKRPPELNAQVLPVTGHIPPIQHVLEDYGDGIAKYLRDGIEPSFV